MHPLKFIEVLVKLTAEDIEVTIYNIWMDSV